MSERRSSRRARLRAAHIDPTSSHRLVLRASKSGYFKSVRIPRMKRGGLVTKVWRAKSAYAVHLGSDYGLQELDSALREQFQDLAREWRRDTAIHSSLFEIIVHPAYQQIIGMGSKALPFIFEELERRPGHWFWALTSITRTDPVAEGATMSEARDAWLAWGRRHRYLRREHRHAEASAIA